MTVPKSLADWNIEALYELVDNDYHEDDSFDFKEVLDTKTGGHTEQILKAACSLANTRGGFLVFGVSEKGIGRERLIGIPDSRENSKHVSDKLKGAEPSVRFDVMNPPVRLGDKVVLVVQIHPADRGPHRGPKRQFWKRVQGAAEEMTYAEIESAFNNYDQRISRLRLVFASLVDNWLRFTVIAAPRQSDAEIATAVPDASLLRQHLGEVAALCPEIMGAIFDVLKCCDSIAFRISLMVPMVNMIKSQKGPTTLAHNQAVAQEIDAIRAPL